MGDYTAERLIEDLTNGNFSDARDGLYSMPVKAACGIVATAYRFWPPMSPGGQILDRFLTRHSSD